MERPSLCLRRERLRWIGHVMRQDEPVLLEVLTFSPEGGSRGRGRPRLRYYDTLKADLKARGVELLAKKQKDFWTSLSAKAEDRVSWRTIVNS